MQTSREAFNYDSKRGENKLSKSHTWHNNWGAHVAACSPNTFQRLFEILEAKHTRETYRCLSYVGARHEWFDAAIFALIGLGFVTALRRHCSWKTLCFLFPFSRWTSRKVCRLKSHCQAQNKNFLRRVYSRCQMRWFRKQFKFFKKWFSSADIDFSLLALFSMSPAAFVSRFSLENWATDCGKFFSFCRFWSSCRKLSSFW